MKQRVKSDKGAVIGFIYLIFVVLAIGILALTISVSNNAKYVDSLVFKDSAYYFADYGMNKAKSEVDIMIGSKTDIQLKNYYKDKQLFVKDVNDVLTGLFNNELDEQPNLLALKVTIEESGENFLIKSIATYRGRSLNTDYTKRLAVRVVYEVELVEAEGGNYVIVKGLIYGNTTEVKE